MKNKISYLPIVLGLLSLALTLPLVALKLSDSKNVTNLKSQAETSVESSASIFPANASYALSSVALSGVTAGVMMDSAGRLIQTANFIITFDPTLVSVQSINPGKLFDKYTVTKFDNKNGEIDIVGFNLEPRAVNGVLADFKLLPSRFGEIKLQFVRNIGVTVTTPGILTVK